MAFKEIDVDGAPAFLFNLKEPAEEGFSLRFVYGVTEAMGEVVLVFPPGLKAQVWMLPDDLIAARAEAKEAREFEGLMKSLGGEQWVSKIQHPHYPK